MKKSISTLKRIGVSLLVMTAIFGSAYTTTSAATATSNAKSMVNTNYSTQVNQNTSYRLTVDGVDKTSAVNFVAQGDRSMIGLRDFAGVLGCTVDWDNEKVAIVTKGSTTLEVPIGSPNILVNGQQKAIDQQGTISIIVNSRTYLPFRVIAESLGYTVGYDTDTKTIQVTSGSSTQPTPNPQPTPHGGQDQAFLETDNKYNVTIPAGMENTTWLKTYNALRDEFGCTHEQAMQSMQYVSPAPKWEADNTNDGDTRKMSNAQVKHYGEIAKANTLATRAGTNPAPQDKGYPGELREGGWLFNGVGWTNGDSLAAGTIGLAR